MRRQVTRLCASLVLFNIVVVVASSQSVDALRGAANCKDCTEESFTFAECQHWNPNLPDPNNPGKFLPTACKKNICIEDIIYFAKCVPAKPSEDNCNQEEHDALGANQIDKTGGGPFKCGKDPGGDTDDWPAINTVKDFPKSGPCMTNVLDDPTIKGKCFIPSCPGTEIDEVDGVKFDPNRTFGRKVCVF
jgi:hypothetical protein